MGKKVWVSIKDLVEITGYSKTRIHEFIKRGNIKRQDWRMATVKGRKSYLIRRDEALANIKATVNARNRNTEGPNAPKLKEIKYNNQVISPKPKPPPAARKSEPDPGGQDAVTKYGFGNLSIAEAQEEQARQKAAELKTKNDALTGKLVDRAEVEEKAFNCARLTRDAILNIPERVSAELASITDPHKVNTRLTAELISALEELSNSLS